jgi:GNAT superfamily N-acetyltransferase
MNVFIRAASSDDIAVISEFNCCLAKETENKTLDRTIVLNGVKRGMELGDEVQYYVAEDDAGVIGQIMLTREWSDWRNGWMIWLQSVYVSPEKRGAGVFRMLFQRSIDMARLRCNPVCVRLYVEHENEIAITAYHRLGFQVSGYQVMEMAIE